MTQQSLATASFWKNKRVFITGGTGLLGCHLTRKLVEQGAEVIALVRDSVPRSLFFDSSHEWNLTKKLITIRGEVENYSLLERVMNEYEVDSIFHLAAQTLVGTAQRGPVATFKANIEGTWNLLEAARVHSKKVERVVIASSDKAYGNLQGSAYNEETPLRGEHPYDVSKSCADLIARSYYVSYGLPVAVTRCGNFFGPGDLNFSRLIPGIIRDILQEKPPQIRSDGTPIRDYIFVEDGADAYLTLAQAMVKEPSSPGKTAHAGEAFNFSYGQGLSVKHVTSQILQKMNRPDLIPIYENKAAHEIPAQHLDSSKAARVLNWKPRYGFDEGLSGTIGWYRNFLKDL